LKLAFIIYVSSTFLLCFSTGINVHHSLEGLSGSVADFLYLYSLKWLKPDPDVKNFSVPCSVADPGSGIVFFPDLGSRILDPKPIFLRAW
jgi:hypothetical protein